MRSQPHDSADLAPGIPPYEVWWVAGTVGRCAENVAPRTGIRSPDHPARGEWIYQLSSSGPVVVGIRVTKAATNSLLG